ncbi:hypothetical protein FXO38_09925 [Capsicum annuum]|nr:hypothetical protein FXO38_09925 [Capsicum annuum]
MLNVMCGGRNELLPLHLNLWVIVHNISFQLQPEALWFHDLSPEVHLDDSARLKKGRGKTRGKGLEKIKKAMGSKMKIEIPIAFVAIRAEIGEKESEGVEPNRIEFYKYTHYTSGKGWSYEEAETNYNNMNDLKTLCTSGESSIPINEIMDAVLGTKSGYIIVFGYGPQPNTIRETQRRTTELEDTLKKAKLKATSAQNELQK